MHQRAFPLGDLGKRLLSFGPPHMSSLLDIFETTESYEDFLRLVAQYLPESLDQIRQAGGVVERIQMFADHFSQRYFPLAWYLEEGDPYDELGYDAVFAGDWENGIPIRREGHDFDDVHDIDMWDGGELLMGSIALPGILDDDGVVWIEACVAQYPRHEAQIRRLPPGGWTHTDLQYYLEGSQYEVLTLWTTYVVCDILNAFLGTNNERGFADPWSQETVEYLVEDWREAQVFHRESRQLADSLETVANYTKLLDFIFQQEAKFGPGHEIEGPPAPPRTLLEVFTQGFTEEDEDSC